MKIKMRTLRLQFAQKLIQKMHFSVTYTSIHIRNVGYT